MKCAQPKPLAQILVKPTGPDCNLACAYCFYSPKKALFSGKGPHLMGEEVLHAMIRSFLADGSGELSIVWQGGEPTLMGLSFFQKAVSLEEAYGRGLVIGNALQTNGILLDNEWARLLREYRFLVGLSLDGPRHVHDRYRVRPDGVGTWQATVERARMLLEEGVSVNALVVIHDYAARYPEEIYEFHKDLGLTFMQFIPYLGNHGEPQTGPSRFAVSAEAYGHFLCRLFDRWRKDVAGARAETSIRFFDSLFYRYLGLSPPECSLRPECGNYVVVEHNGDVYACDFFVEPPWRLGNVLRDDLAGLLNGERQARFGRQKALLPPKCRECRWLEFCHGGCTAYRKRGEEGVHRLCSGLKTFYAHADPHFRRIASDWRKRQALEEGAAAGSVKVGRNAPCPCGSGKKYKRCCGR